MKPIQTANFKIGKQKIFFMKSIFLVFAFYTLTGCKKEEVPLRSYLLMVVNGEKVGCDFIWTSDFVPPSVSHTQLLEIYGVWKLNKPREGKIEILLYGFDNTPGKKSFTSPSSVRVMLTQVDSNGDMYEDYYFASENDVNLTILEVSERHIKGKFDITAKMNTGPDTYESLIISGGDFHINRR